MKLGEILDESLIKIPIENIEKKAIIKEMIDVLDGSGKIKEKESVLQAVLEREQMMSTGIGNGVAIPHGKSAGSEDLIVSLGITSEEVDFEALDNKPVRIVFLLTGPQTASNLHIKMLSRISRLLNQSSFRNKLIECQNPKEVMEVIEEEEKHLD